MTACSRVAACAAGTLIECLAAGEGSGAGTLAFVLARRFVTADSRGQGPEARGQRSEVGGQRSEVVVIDARGEFYPPAAVGLGLDLDEMILVRPEGSREALWALEQSLRCPGVGVTLAWSDRLDESDRSGRLDSRTFRRLALGIETGGGLGLLLRSAARQRDPSWAHVRLLIEPQTTNDGTLTTHHSPLTDDSPAALLGKPWLNGEASRRLHIHLLRGRKGHVVESLELELCDEPPDPVRLAAPLAGPAAPVRATGT